MTETGARSSVLAPLHAMFAMSLMSSLGAIAAHAPTWLIALFSAFPGLVVLVYLIGFVYFMIKKPELLRSETYGLQMTAMEKGIIGDSLSGTKSIVLDSKTLPEPVLITNSSEDQK